LNLKPIAMPNVILNRLERLDYFIRIKATGTPQELASKLGLSRSSLYEYINVLKERGAVIHFCRKRHCFYYQEEGCFQFTFMKKEFTPEEKEKLTTDRRQVKGIQYNLR
jgi:predicted DNA-binding transcriptional regulator YafY